MNILTRNNVQLIKKPSITKPHFSHKAKSVTAIVALLIAVPYFTWLTIHDSNNRNHASLLAIARQYTYHDGQSVYCWNIQGNQEYIPCTVVGFQQDRTWYFVSTNDNAAENWVEVDDMSRGGQN